jgi:hypothetical protein
MAPWLFPILILPVHFEDVGEHGKLSGTSRQDGKVSSFSQSRSTILLEMAWFVPHLASLTGSPAYGVKIAGLLQGDNVCQRGLTGQLLDADPSKCLGHDAQGCQLGENARPTLCRKSKI